MNKNIIIRICTAIPILTGLVLLGVTDSLNFGLNTNIANTGFLVKYALAILNGFLAWAIYKKLAF